MKKQNLQLETLANVVPTEISARRLADFFFVGVCVVMAGASVAYSMSSSSPATRVEEVDCGAAMVAVGLLQASAST